MKTKQPEPIEARSQARPPITTLKAALELIGRLANGAAAACPPEIPWPQAAPAPRAARPAKRKRSA